ncbi:MMPL family transporter [Actinomadura algeriensis]|uniref:Membrane protein YdfJ with MMPL/SSD domain n=1 Tax=Actinomadura algeriensis TaxID=1679523 RepID=A0ABR9JUY8_9ACTN|nr:MMPL family transporter [Actinomadura algeriensis]MBE1534298.1 putative membrane protein YdfJ with MMPL/SSD domain [Actinomadura algeriensis]
MTLTELDREENTRPPSRKAAFVRIAGWAHRRRWLALILWVAVLGGVWGVASHVFTIADWTPPIMILVGLGVGIDYALLIFTRYRAELVRGADPEAATVHALDAAGRSVFFAGCTVILALLGLSALGRGSLQGMALSVALTVLVTMPASLTLLPALLGIFGHIGSVITAAGAIMVVIFGAFVLSPDRLLRQAGFGMAVAIFVDAVIIRCLIVPAAMELMGRRAWWLPAPLARLLPKVELERVSE